MRNENLIFLFLNQNICCGYSKEPSCGDGSFEHPKQMFKLKGKKIIIILRYKFLLNWPYVVLRPILVMSAEITPDNIGIGTKSGKASMFHI